MTDEEIREFEEAKAELIERKVKFIDALMEQFPPSVLNESAIQEWLGE